ncbi:glycosyltransferase family 2 protein [candidate division FCPU426 bacterium]|nr:glycosyltransferase family 2 protein [candidate division FCPU426 bacterium]
MKKGFCPPNSLCRAAAKTIWHACRHAGRFWPRVTLRQVLIFIRYLQQREYALLEAKLQSLCTSPPVKKYYHSSVLHAADLSLAPSAATADLVWHIILIVRRGEEALCSRTIASISAQTRSHWRVWLVYEPGVSERCLESARSLISIPRLECIERGRLHDSLPAPANGFAAFLHPGDMLAPQALACCQQAVQREPETELIYTDSSEGGFSSPGPPFYKPDWSPELLLGMDYIQRAFFISTAFLQQHGGWQQSWNGQGGYSVLLQAAESKRHIIHLPEVLFALAPRSPQPEERLAAVRDALTRRGQQADPVWIHQSGLLHIRRRLDQSPLVSVIVPTALKDLKRLEACLRSVAHKSSYPHYEMILMDNSCDRGQNLLQAQYSKIGKRFECIQDETPFNYSHLNNLGAGASRGEYLLFLNDDTEVITADWIETMLSYAQLADVAVVGAKLLYPDESVQHGGVFVVNQGAYVRHAFRYLRRPENSYQHLLEVTRECSAVTFACALVRKSVFVQLGGLEESLRVEGNDIDFCLRARLAGYRILWTPFAQLYHHELVSRCTTHFADDLAFFRQRWQALLEQGDPYHNPNLNEGNDFYLP